MGVGVGVGVEVGSGVGVVATVADWEVSLAVAEQPEIASAKTKNAKIKFFTFCTVEDKRAYANSGE